MPDLTPLQKFADQTLLFLPVLVGGLIIFIIFWVISVIVGRVVRRICKGAKFDELVSRVISDFVRVTILVIGMITALGTLGINVSALVAGVGLTSLALGLALQPIVGNAVSGLLIMIYQPFHLGDTINVLGNEGKVLNVNLRSVTLEAENKHILVPNQSVLSNVVLINQGTGQAALEPSKPEQKPQ